MLIKRKSLPFLITNSWDVARGMCQIARAHSDSLLLKRLIPSSSEKAAQGSIEPRVTLPLSQRGNLAGAAMLLSRLRDLGKSGQQRMHPERFSHSRWNGPVRKLLIDPLIHALQGFDLESKDSTAQRGSFDEIYSLLSQNPSQCPRVLIDNYIASQTVGMSLLEAEEYKHKLLTGVLQIVERHRIVANASIRAAFNTPGIGSLVDSPMKPFSDLVHKAEAEGKRGQLIDAIKRRKIQLVFTAHPTTMIRTSIRRLEDEFTRCFTEGKFIHFTKGSELYELASKLAHSSMMNSIGIEPIHETERIVAIMLDVLPVAVPNLIEEINRALNLTGEEALNISPYSFRIWSGDMDGNGKVGGPVIEESANHLQQKLQEYYKEACNDIKNSIPHGHRALDISMLLWKKLQHGQNVKAKEDGQFESMSEYFVQTERQGTFSPETYGYFSPVGFIKDLAHIRDLLLNLDEDRQNPTISFHSQVDKINRLIQNVEAFGFHAATIDNRINSSDYSDCIEYLGKHLLNIDKPPSKDSNEVLSQLLNKSFAPGDYKKLIAQLNTQIKDEKDDSQLRKFKATKRVLEAIDAIRRERALKGKKTIENLIISDSESKEHIFNVIAIAKFCYESQEDSTEKSFADFDLNIVPLFEKENSLKLADTVMEEVILDPVYESHMDRVKKLLGEFYQYTMLGHSDSRKDGGFVVGAVEVSNAEKKLTDLYQKYPDRINRYRFFHGIGGSPARGGGLGTTNTILMTHPSNEHDYTIQGGSVPEGFSGVNVAVRSLCSIFCAELEKELFPPPVEDPKNLLQSLSQFSSSRYREQTAEPQTLNMIESLLQCLGRLNYWSRPFVRSQNLGALSMNNVRAIPYFGSWKELNLPFEIYGLGHALDEIKSNHGISSLKELFQNNIIFRGIVENATISLLEFNNLKDHHLMNHPIFGGTVSKMVNDACLTKQIILEIKDQTELETVKRLPDYARALQQDFLLVPRGVIAADMQILWRLNDSLNKAIPENDELRNKMTQLIYKGMRAKAQQIDEIYSQISQELKNADKNPEEPVLVDTIMAIATQTINAARRVARATPASLVSV